MCDIKSILSIGINKNITYKELFNIITPFANEIANVITISGIMKLYVHHPESINQKFQVFILDFVALVGLCSNVATYSKKYNYNMGLVKGVLLVVFSYLIPNFFMNTFLQKVQPKYRLLVGLLTIYCLELYISTTTCIAKPLLYDKDDKENKENKEN
jgi:hypothetical protein